MQRDMHKLRALVLAVESGDFHAVVPEGVHDYVQIAVEAGLMTGLMIGNKHYPLPSLQLTNAGHDFASLVRNDAIWNRVAQRIAERTETAPFGTWLSLLDAEQKKVLSDN